MTKDSKDFWDTVSIPDPAKLKQTHKGVTLLVDADIIAYQSAATTDGREYLVGSKNFKYKKDAVDYCKGNGYSIHDIVLNYRPDPESYALHNINQSVKNLMCKFPGAKIMMFLTGSVNFRKDINDEYKAHRDGAYRPTHLSTCKQYIVNRYNGIVEEGLEADDLIGIEAYKIGDSLQYIICTIDKDLDTIPGDHYNWRKDTNTMISHTQAMKNFYTQCLTGDNTDNIKGIKGIGPKTAEKIINGVAGDTPYDYYKAVRDTWIKKFFPGYEKNHEEMDKAECLKRMIEITEDMHKSAQCLYILHEPFVMWEPPIEEEPAEFGMFNETKSYAPKLWSDQLVTRLASDMADYIDSCVMDEIIQGAR